MYKRVSTALELLLLVVLLGTCGSSIYFMQKDPGLAPRPTLLATAAPTLAAGQDVQVSSCSATNALADHGWSSLQRGLERRVIEICDEQSQPVESVHIWRLDQKHFRLDVAFNERPKSLETWQRETNAMMVVNGGYYSVEDERYFPDGLTIVNGRASGHSFNGFGGMLAIADSGAELRWLVQQPYSSFEPLRAALQSFPILVEPGGQLGFGAERENHVSARRTVIAQDKQGRILFIVAPQKSFTLHQLSVFLTGSDLDLDIAVNLDGGGSTGILVANPREIIPSDRALPFVILVYPR